MLWWNNWYVFRIRHVISQCTRICHMPKNIYEQILLYCWQLTKVTYFHPPTLSLLRCHVCWFLVTSNVQNTIFQSMPSFCKNIYIFNCAVTTFEWLFLNQKISPMESFKQLFFFTVSWKKWTEGSLNCLFTLTLLTQKAHYMGIARGSRRPHFGNRSQHSFKAQMKS